MSQFRRPAPGYTLIQGARVIDPHADIDRVVDVLVTPTHVIVDPTDIPEDSQVIQADGLWAVPGFIDLQVHFREPGFETKETLRTGSRAAFAGGVTSVVVMPNTMPTLDTPEAVRFQQDRAREVEGVRVLVAAAATTAIKGDVLTDYAALKEAGAVAVTDDGYPLAGDDVMRESLALCATNDLLFMQHAEDPKLSAQGVMNAGPTADTLGFKGQSPDAEGVMVERDVKLAEAANARYHVLHMSTARSLEAIKAAKSRGARVTCEASPHHLLLTDAICATGSTFTKMNPPLRGEKDRSALIAGLADGSIDAVATDHAPHAAHEKALPFAKAPFGIIGLETAFASVLTFVHDGTISATRAVDLMTSGPARVLARQGQLGTFGERAPGDLTLVDPNQTWKVTQQTLHGKQVNTPFWGREFKGRVVATFHEGSLRYDDLTQ